MSELISFILILFLFKSNKNLVLNLFQDQIKHTIMGNKSNIDEQRDKLRKIQDVFKLIKEKDIKMIDFRFIDLPGQWQHFSIKTN